jgi:hypothetical protein
MSEYDPDNPSVDDDDPVESPTPIRRVGHRDRKRQLRRNKRGDDTNPFDALDAADDSELIEPASELPNTPGRPLPDDVGAEGILQGDYVLDQDDRFPPVVIARPQTRNQRRSQARSGSSRTEIDRSQPMASRRRAARQNRIALLFFLATLAVIAYFVYIWQNPYSVLNPLAPERPVIYVTATPGPGTPDNVNPPASEAAVPYSLSGDVQTSAASDQCDRVILTGLIQGTTPQQNFAVRVINENGSGSGVGVDEGVVTSYFEEARAQVYLISLPMPPVQTTVTVQMFDLAGQAVSASVQVTMTPDCTANRISINFAPQPQTQVP